MTGKYSVALIDTPMHENIGDHAITLAERSLFDEVFGFGGYLEITADEIDQREEIFSQLIPRDTLIFVHGGGFLGEIWIEEEFRFRRILEAFHNHKIIVLPQTAHFDLSNSKGKEIFCSSYKAYSSHQNLIICAREKKTYNFFLTHMPSLNVCLLPDSVLSYFIPDNQIERNNCILYCWRSDKEKSQSDKLTNEIEHIVNDFLGEEFTAQKTDMIFEDKINSRNRLDIVLSKVREFQEAKLVVTDRLHGMVFSLLSGTPCVAFNNSSGKVKALYEWIQDVDYIKFADSLDSLSESLKDLNLDKKYSFQQNKFRNLLISFLRRCRNE